MDEIALYFELPIDFEGQKLAYALTVNFSYLYSLLAVFLGFLTQNLLITVYVFAAGYVANLVLAGPNWPIYNKNPVSWLLIDFFSSEDKKEVSVEQEEDPVAIYSL